MKNNRQFPIIVILSLLPWLAGGSGATTVYWLESNFNAPVLVAADTSGAQVSADTLPPASLPQSLTYSSISHQVIYSELAFVGARIRGVGAVVPDTASLLGGLSALRGICFDHSSNELYFTTTNLLTGSGISRVSANGTGYEPLIGFSPLGNDEPYSIAINSAGDTVYFTNFGIGAIEKAAAMPSASPSTIVSGLAGPAGLAIDGNAGVLYWTELTGRRILSMHLDGSLTKLILTGVDSPNSIAFDPAGMRIYWTEFNTATVKSSRPDGTDIRVLKHTAAPPSAVAIANDVATPVRPEQWVAGGPAIKIFAMLVVSSGVSGGSSLIRYQLPVRSHVELTLFSLRAREVRMLVDATREAGNYEVLLSNAGVPAGTYLCRMTAGPFRQTSVCTLVR
jgi:hypothetical protein